MQTKTLTFNEECAGNYQLSPGRIVTIGQFDDFGGQLSFLDGKTHRFGLLHLTSETTFFSGPAFGDASHADIEFEFIRDQEGKVSQLVWKENGKKAITARRVFRHQVEQVSFQNGPITLRGVLILPSKKGPHPVVVFAHGSGEATRNIGYFNYFFLQLGIGVLAFDKRGCGESTGDWRTSSFEDLASDLLCAVEFLKDNPKVDARHIGIYGSSQGGWIGAIAAARSRDIAFLIERSGSGMTVAENIVYEIEGNLRQDRFSEVQIQECLDFTRKVVMKASNGDAWEEIDALYQGVIDQPWAKYAFPAGLPEGDAWFTWLKLNGHVDPIESLRQVICPVLWFFGDLDRKVPSAASEFRIEAAFYKSGNQDLTIKTLSPAGHGLNEGVTGFADEFLQARRYVPGFFETMSAWLKEKVRN